MIGDDASKNIMVVTWKSKLGTHHACYSASVFGKQPLPKPPIKRTRFILLIIYFSSLNYVDDFNKTKHINNSCSLIRWSSKYIVSLTMPSISRGSLHLAWTRGILSGSRHMAQLQESGTLYAWIFINRHLKFI